VAKAGALERAHVRLQLIREIATGEHTQSELAARYGVTQQAISDFTQRHAQRIADVAAKLDDEFAGLWVANKAKRIATYQQQIDDIAELLGDPEQAVKAGVGYAETVRTAQAAMRAVADELGQIPARMQVEHSGSLNVQLNGVDLEALR
jgi:transposase-like protein